MQWYSVITLVVLAAVASAQDDFYNGKWNGVNTHDIVDNDRLFQKYKTCLIGSTTGCPQDALELRKVFPEALREACARCSPEQQTKIKDTLEYICQKRSSDFAEVLKHIDPENKYRPGFEAKFGKLAGAC